MKNNVSIGKQIRHTAYIYFGFNQPIVTNTTQMVTTGYGVSSLLNQESEIRISPGSAHDKRTAVTPEN